MKINRRKDHGSTDYLCDECNTSIASAILEFEPPEDYFNSGEQWDRNKTKRTLPMEEVRKRLLLREQL